MFLCEEMTTLLMADLKIGLPEDGSMGNVRNQSQQLSSGHVLTGKANSCSTHYSSESNLDCFDGKMKTLYKNTKQK